MKSSKWIIIAVLVAGLLLSTLAACGGGTESTAVPTAQPTEAVQAQPTQAPPPTQAPQNTEAPADTPAPEATVSAGLDTSTLASESNLSSYRSNMTITTTGTQNGQQVQETLEMSIEYTKDPLVQHIVMSGTGFSTDGTAGSIDMYQTADTTYMQMGDQWLSVPASEGDQFSQGILKPQDLLQDTCGWKKEKDTEMGGVKVSHYTTTKADMLKCAPLSLFGGAGEITDAGGDIYVAVQDNYVAQMDFFYVGTDLSLGIGGADESVQQGRLEIYYSMTDVNQPFTIQIPEAALNAGNLPEDIPVPPDAEEVSNMFGMITFNSASTPQDISDFYKAEMPNNGWTQNSAEEMGGMFLLEYAKDARTASFMISTDSDTGKTSVVITVQEGQ